jgi:hypothetical protein
MAGVVFCFQVTPAFLPSDSCCPGLGLRTVSPSRVPGLALTDPGRAHTWCRAAAPPVFFSSYQAMPHGPLSDPTCGPALWHAAATCRPSACGRSPSPRRAAALPMAALATSRWRRTKVVDDIFTSLPLIVLCPAFIRFKSDLSRSSRVRFVSSSSMR